MRAKGSGYVRGNREAARARLVAHLKYVEHRSRTGIAQRMLFSLAGNLVTPDFAKRAYEDAKEKAGREIARPEG